MKYNDLLISHNQKNLKQIKEQVSGDEYLALLGWLQHGIPLGELKKLLTEGPVEKQFVEFDPSSGSLSKPKAASLLFGRIIKHLPDVLDNGLSMVLYGPNGCGKTMSALHVLAHAIEDGYEGYYLNFKDFLRDYNRHFHAYFDEDVQLKEYIDYIYNCDMLVLDEVGKESNTTENVVSAFESLIKHRVSMDKSTILICNLDMNPEAKTLDKMVFYKKYGGSIYDALMEKYKMFLGSKKAQLRLKNRPDWGFLNEG